MSMKAHTEEKIERHMRFLEMKEVNRPLIGFVAGWENFNRYFKPEDGIFKEGIVDIERIDSEKFIDVYKRYLQSMDYEDDLFHTAEPFSSIPWAEAAMGCPVQFTGKDLWAKKIDRPLSEVISNYKDSAGKWLKKYGELIDIIASNFGELHPVGQPILRGPLDMVSAIVGSQNMIYGLYDEPETYRELLSVCSEVFIRFLELHKSKAPAFHGGHVIGQFYIWTPGTSARIQEDDMALLSPGLYEEFLREHDLQITRVAEYNLFHTHASTLFMLDYIIKNDNIKIIQVGKDEGATRLEDMMPGLRKVQASGKCLVLKGRLSANDFDLINKKLDKSGLCLQIVVDSISEKDEILERF